MRLYELLNEVGQDPEDITQPDLSRSERNALMVFNAFRNAGFSPAQAEHLTGEIHRENAFQDRYLFGTHRDPANNATNLGMISWQGPRAPALETYMREIEENEGIRLFDDNGNMLRNQDVLNAQARFVRHEMETGSHGGSRRQNERIQTWLANENPPDNLSRDILGGSYIRWALNNPQYRNSGLQNRAEGMSILRRAADAGGVNLNSTTASVPPIRVANAGSMTGVATDNNGLSLANVVNLGQTNDTPTRTIDQRFDAGSLANVGTTQYNLRRGSSGENVSQLQTQLQNLGYDVGTTGADGKYGRNTAAAVRQFQTDYGLQVDSIAGDQTMSALQQASSLKVEPPKSDFTVPTPTPSSSGSAGLSPEVPAISTPKLS
jgi:hypothetical protein